MLVWYAEAETVSEIARHLKVNRAKVERTIGRALQFDATAALDDLPRAGRPRQIPDEARA